jgi:hypothetical protein
MEDPFELIARTVSRGDVEAEIDQIDRELEGLWERKRKLQTLLTLLPPDGGGGDDEPESVPAPPVKPSLAEAILRVMAEQSHAAWSGEEVLTALARKDWAPGGKTPKNSVAATLSRLRDEGRLRRVDRGLYELPPETSGGDSAGAARPATLLDDETGRTHNMPPPLK